MQRSVTGMSTSRGFTLIEILIVIVIIGITVGFALLAFGDFGASRRIVFAAEQLENTLQVAQHQAILENSTLGLQIDNIGYQILKFQEATKWKAVSNRGIFKPNYFPQGTVINLKTNNALPLGGPVLIISPSGDMTPFELWFGTSKENKLALLAGSSNGTLTLTLNQKK